MEHNLPTLASYAWSRTKIINGGQCGQPKSGDIWRTCVSCPWRRSMAQCPCRLWTRNEPSSGCRPSSASWTKHLWLHQRSSWSKSSKELHPPPPHVWCVSRILQEVVVEAWVSPPPSASARLVSVVRNVPAPAETPSAVSPCHPWNRWRAGEAHSTLPAGLLPTLHISATWFWRKSRGKISTYPWCFSRFVPIIHLQRGKFKISLKIST